MSYRLGIAPVVAAAVVKGASAFFEPTGTFITLPDGSVVKVSDQAAKPRDLARLLAVAIHGSAQSARGSSAISEAVRGIPVADTTVAVSAGTNGRGIAQRSNVSPASMGALALGLLLLLRR